MEAVPWKGFKGQKDSRRALSPTIHSLLFLPGHPLGDHIAPLNLPPSFFPPPPLFSGSRVGRDSRTRLVRVPCGLEPPRRISREDVQGVVRGGENYKNVGLRRQKRKRWRGR